MPHLAASLGVGMEWQSGCWLLGRRDGRSAGVLSTEARTPGIKLFRERWGSWRARHSLVWDRLLGPWAEMLHPQDTRIQEAFLEEDTPLPSP